jgi:hypothetical protein
MNQIDEVTDRRRNGQATGHIPSIPSSADETLARIRRTEYSLGISISQDGIVPTPEGLVAAAREHGFQLMSPAMLLFLDSIKTIGAVCIGIFYGLAIRGLLDAIAVDESIVLVVVGIVLSVSNSAIVQSIWFRYVLNNGFSKRRNHGIVSAVVWTILIALVDISVQGYFLHSLLTQDSFLPPSMIVQVASFGLSTMVTTVLILLARLVGCERALVQIAQVIVLDRALNDFHEEVAHAIILLEHKESSGIHNRSERHRPK